VCLDAAFRAIGRSRYLCAVEARSASAARRGALLIGPDAVPAVSPALVAQDSAIRSPEFGV
jgi:hypothetical protein